MRAPKAAVFAALALAVLPALCRADVIDRVLAVVGGTVITQSDVTAAIEFGLVPSPPPGVDPLRAALDQLIRRELILNEASRYSAVESDPSAVETQMLGTRARFASAADYQAALRRTAMTESRLRDLVEGNVRIADYLRQRFGGVAEPAESDVAAYYAAHRPEFTSGGRALTLQEAAPVVRQRLIDERRSALIEEWVARLRRRAEVTDLYFANPK